MTVLLLALLPILILIVAHFVFPQKVTLAELAAGVAISLLLMFALYQVGRYSQMADTELWNGEITGTDRDIDYYRDEIKSCDSKGENCTTRIDEGHIMKWTAQSNIGEFTIERIDCGSASRFICTSWYPDPDRWTDIRIGDPVTKQNTYMNYLQGAGNGLFHTNAATLDPAFVPDLDYPIDVYDIYNVDRVLTDGVVLPGGAGIWNTQLAEILKTLGPQRQANMILVMTNSPSSTYADVLMTKWEGANKNDIVIVAGFPSGTMEAGPAWVSVNSWAKSDIMNVQMRDDLLGHADWWSSPSVLMPNIQRIVMDRFERQPMEDFEYLKDEIEPSMGMMILITILGAMAGVGMAVYAIKHDVFDTGQGTKSYRPKGRR